MNRMHARQDDPKPSFADTPDAAGNGTAAAVTTARPEKPTRRRSEKQASNRLRGNRVGFIILRKPTNRPIPAYTQMLKGVSAACDELELDLSVGFEDTDSDFVSRLTRQRFDGLILHGTMIPDDVAQPLQQIPTVWLLGNRTLPSWGDQVMPDNSAIGQLAAQYLLGLGHQNVVYFGMQSAWFMRVRALAFRQAIQAAGGHVTTLSEPVTEPRGGEQPPTHEATKKLVQVCRSLPTRPTGIFVAEDWLLRSVYGALQTADIRVGQDLDIISCNNDQPYLSGLMPVPATIDIKFERISTLGVHRLVDRMKQGTVGDRLRILVEPTIVLPPEVAARDTH